MTTVPLILKGFLPKQQKKTTGNSLKQLQLETVQIEDKSQTNFIGITTQIAACGDYYAESYCNQKHMYTTIL